MSLNTLQLPVRRVEIGERVYIFICGAAAGATAVIVAAVAYLLAH